MAEREFDMGELCAMKFGSECSREYCARSMDNELQNEADLVERKCGEFESYREGSPLRVPSLV